MSPNSDRIVELAGAILDGTSVDWTSETSGTDLTGQLLLDQLKLLAAVADVHRRIPLISLSTRAERELDSDMPSAEWGHLRVLERIGRGAFGDVYRAWDTRLDREVALKLMPADPASGDSRVVTSIIEEGRLLARVRHPNVVTIYGAERIGQHVGLWMELVHGQTLQQMLTAGRSFTPAEAIDIGVELCRAVDAVHAAGLLHRDIKPHNVMVDASGRVVLMDFGTGREVSDPSAVSLAGTPLYLAPELLSGKESSPQSDVYSLGVLLFHILTRGYPVRAVNLHDLRLAHDRGERTALKDARQDLPRALARVIDRALNPEPGERYQRAGSLAEDLIRLRGRHRALAVACGVALAAGLVLLVWAGTRSGATTDGDRNGSPAAVATTPNPERRSIAVLPFKPVVPTEVDEGLQLGMTDALIAHLGRAKTLRIEPLARVRAYVAASMAPREAGGVLGVDTVVQGYVGKTPTGVQVRLQAFRTADGATLDGSEVSDIFPNPLEAQRRIALSLSKALALTSTERGLLTRQETTSTEAFQRYSFGLYHLEVFNAPRMEEAEREFLEAIKFDPRYARPYAALALTQLNKVWVGSKRGNQVRESARAAALKAIELDESVALAYTVLGHIYQYFDYAPFEAQRAHLRAMELDDQDVSVLRAYSFFLLHHNAIDEALDIHGRTLALYPASPLSTKISAEMYYVARRYEECVTECRKAMTLEPNDADLMLSIWLGRCLEQQGKYREAVDAFESGRAARGEGALAERFRRAFERGGWKEYWRERIPTTAPKDQGLGSVAVFARLGNLDEAFRILEQSEQTRSLGGFANYPDYDPLRSDPRFKALLVRIGLDDETNAQLAAARGAARGAAR